MIRSLQCICVLLFLLVNRSSIADPARFWISTSGTTSDGPIAPSITGVQGDIKTLYIWAQPMTTNAGPWHATSNPFLTLQNVSLNLVTDQPVVDFLNNGITVPNPALTTTDKRYQFTFDSTEGLTSSFSSLGVMDGNPDRINGIQAFTIEPGPTYLGLGPTCHPGDTSCAITTNGSPAWLISAVNYQIVTETGTTNFYLQVGGNGIRHVEASSSGTFVLFGSNASTTEPIYNASADRQTTLFDDAPDFTLTVSASTPGDYNGDNAVNAADYVRWRDGLAAPYTPLDPQDYQTWRQNFGSSFGSGSQAGVNVPEPASLALIFFAAASVRLLKSRLLRTPIN